MRFLEDGQRGGIISCLVFAVQFLYTAAYAYGNNIFEKIMFVLLENNERYRNSLPETVYITNYMDSNETVICGFDSSIDPKETDLNGADIRCTDMKKIRTF